MINLVPTQTPTAPKARAAAKPRPSIIDAAATKWNYSNYRPGLVGVHCIGVDPYYLTYKAKLVGYYPEIVSSGRRINENMSNWIAEKIVINICKNNGRKIQNRIGFTMK